jgi:hypothetical protein
MFVGLERPYYVSRSISFGAYVLCPYMSFLSYCDWAVSRLCAAGWTCPPLHSFIVERGDGQTHRCSFFFEKK